MSINPYILPGLGGLNEFKIKQVVCKAYGISESQLLISKRPYIEARYLVMYFAAKYLGVNRSTLAHMFGKKSHSTASDSVRSIENLIATNKQFAKRYAEIDLILKTSQRDHVVEKYRQLNQNTDVFNFLMICIVFLAQL